MRVEARLPVAAVPYALKPACSVCVCVLPVAAVPYTL